jgi:hypothetical protein
VFGFGLIGSAGIKQYAIIIKALYGSTLVKKLSKRNISMNQKSMDIYSEKWANRYF